MGELRARSKTGDMKGEAREDPSLPQRREAEVREGITFTSLSLVTMSIHLLLLKRKLTQQVI